MKFFDRFLLGLYTLAVMTVLLVFGLAVLGWTTPVELLQMYLVNYNERVTSSVIILFFLFVSMKFFLQALSSEDIPEQAVITESELGQIRVSVGALETMAFRVANQVKGVVDIRPRVTCQPEGVKVFLRAVLAPDVSVPEATNEIQTKVQNYISHHVGIKVQSVKILVEDVSKEKKQGLPRKLN